MRNGLAISSALHVGVIVATLYGLPQIFNPLDVEEEHIIVDLVTVAERTTSQKPLNRDEEKDPPPARKKAQDTKPKPESKPEKRAAPTKKMAKLAPPPVPKIAKAAAHTVPKPSKAELTSKEPPEQKPEEVAIRKPKNPKIPKEKPKPTKLVAKSKSSKKFLNLPRPRSKPDRKRRKFNPDRIAALLDKDDEKKPRTPRKKTNWQETVKELSSKIASAPERLRSVPMTMSEIDAIRYQIQQCWSIPAGARNAEKLVIRIKVFLNTDGSLSKAPEIVDTMDQRNNPFYLTAAESARRAILKCAPLKNLPVAKFARWREITLTFNPREMLGG